MDIIRRNNCREGHLHVAAKAYETGNFEAALRIYQQMLTGEPNDPEVLFQIGNIYQNKKDYSSAVKAYRKALILEPSLFEALLNLSIVLRSTGALHQALKTCHQALLVKPDSARAYNHAGTVQYLLGNRQESMRCYLKAIDLEPNLSEAHYNLGNMQRQAGQIAAAGQAYQRAVALKPEFHQAWNGLGDTYRVQGCIEEAMRVYEKAVAVKPEYVPAYRNIAAIRKFHHEDKYIRKMKALLDHTGLNRSERIQLNFALGKAYEDLKQFDIAFAYMHAANQMKRATFQYDPTENDKLFATIKKVFSKAFMDERNDYGVNDPTPIFIMGMPRSGTTLVEQVLSSHPKVLGAGELPTLDQIVTAFGKKVFRERYPGFLERATKEDFSRMGEMYVEKVRGYSQDATFITDKMPQNFLFAGLIRLVLPQATIIHCRRSLLDTSLSIFKNDFSQLHKYAYDLDEIGHYYSLYQDLMKYWKDLIPNGIHDFEYEKIVTDPEKQVQRLLRCCGLEWNDRCLNFHISSRPVLTASTAQVRKPFYRDSIALWRNYERHLVPLLDRLP